MAVSIVNHPDHSSDHTIHQDQSSQPTAGRSRGDWRRGGDQDSGDRFSPSNGQGQGQGQSAQNTGTYSVSQVDIFSIAARFILAQAGTSATNPPVASSSDTSSASTPATSASPAADISSSPTTSATQPASDTATVPNTVANAVPSTTSNAVPNTVLAATPNDSTPAGSQDPLQALNTALTSLGLNQQEIQAFDQVANLINSFSPTAFSDLVSQFQQLAQQMTQAASATSNSQPAAGSTTDGAATPNTDASAPTNGATPVTNTPSGGGMQIQELTIRFSGAEMQRSNGKTGGISEVSAFNLQIEEVNVTLTGGNGQVAQLQTPQQAANADSSGVTQPPASLSTAAA